MTKWTKRLNVRLCFASMDWDTLVEYTISVPENVSADEVQYALVTEYNLICEEVRQLENLDNDKDADLCEGDESDTVILLNRVCEKNGWQWQELGYDIDLNFI